MKYIGLNYYPVKIMLIFLMLLLQSACTKTCDDIKVEYKEEQQAVNEADGNVDDYHLIYTEYTKEFEDAGCLGTVTSG